MQGNPYSPCMSDYIYIAVELEIGMAPPSTHDEFVGLPKLIPSQASEFRSVHTKLMLGFSRPRGLP